MWKRPQLLVSNANGIFRASVSQTIFHDTLVSREIQMTKSPYGSHPMYILHLIGTNYFIIFGAWVGLVQRPSHKKCHEEKNRILASKNSQINFLKLHFKYFSVGCFSNPLSRPKNILNCINKCKHTIALHKLISRPISLMWEFLW